MSGIPNGVQAFMKTATTPTIVCLQEVSVEGEAPNLKIGRDTWLGRGQSVIDSDNQRCNTAIFWSAHFNYVSRRTYYRGNRYYETVKLEFQKKKFWVSSIHMPSGARNNGAALCALIHKEVLERAPLIAVGDMNCIPSDFASENTQQRFGTAVSSGKTTQKSGKELDWMVVNSGRSELQLTATCLGVPDAYISDHLPVGFEVTLE